MVGWHTRAGPAAPHLAMSCGPTEVVTQLRSWQCVGACTPQVFDTASRSDLSRSCAELQTSCSLGRRSQSSLTAVTGTRAPSIEPSRARTLTTGLTSSTAMWLVMQIRTLASKTRAGASFGSGSTRTQTRSRGRSPRSFAPLASLTVDFEHKLDDTPERMRFIRWPLHRFEA